MIPDPTGTGSGSTTLVGMILLMGPFPHTMVVHAANITEENLKENMVQIKLGCLELF